MIKTDPMWVFENYGEAAELIDEHEAVIAQQATRIAELEKFADEANAQMLEAFAERDHALKAQQLSAGVVLPTVEQITEALDDVTCFHDLSAELIAPALLENLRAMIGSTHAGSGVVLPERKPEVFGGEYAGAADWNDCINEVGRLNPCRAQSVPCGRSVGIESVAKMIEMKAEDYAMEFGHDDMGGLSFGSGVHAEVKTDHHAFMIELAEEVRAMLAAAPSAKKESDQ